MVVNDLFGQLIAVYDQRFFLSDLTIVLIVAICVRKVLAGLPVLGEWSDERLLSQED
jgi:hypothetical protein